MFKTVLQIKKVQLESVHVFLNKLQKWYAWENSFAFWKKLNEINEFYVH